PAAAHLTPHDPKPAPHTLLPPPPPHPPPPTPPARHPAEPHPASPQRKRLIVTTKVPALAPDPSNPKATLWNPAGASFEAAADAAGVRSGMIAIIGGPAVFEMFMDRYDTFWLSLAARVKIPGGEGCFAGLPQR